MATSHLSYPTPRYANWAFFPVRSTTAPKSQAPFQFKAPTPVLFAKSPGSESSSNASTTTTADPSTRTGPPTAPPRPGLGYFAFPAGSPPPPVFPVASAAAPAPAVRADSSEQPPKPTPSKAPASTHSRLRALEQAEADRGEGEWVACGGVLRDQYGNVDEARTKKVREEVERKLKEKELKERWDAHDEAWRALVERCRSGAAEEDVEFGDIPWPAWVVAEEDDNKKLVMSISLRPAALRPQRRKKQKIALHDLSVDSVEDFLMRPLSVRGCTVTPKTRIRSSFLRWHPDKLGWLIERVKDDDVEDVKTGIGIVIACLQKLNGKL